MQATTETITQRDIDRIASRITLRNFLVPCAIALSLSEDYGAVRIQFSLELPDRNSGLIGCIRFCRLVPVEYVAAHGEEWLIGIVHEHLKEALMHEVDEAFHVDGIRKFDPHA